MMKRRWGISLSVISKARGLLCEAAESDWTDGSNSRSRLVSYNTPDTQKNQVRKICYSAHVSRRKYDEFSGETKPIALHNIVWVGPMVREQNRLW